MREAEAEGSSGRTLGRVAKDIPAEDRDELLFVKAVRAPTQRRAGEIRKVADRQGLRMTAITPIGIEIAGGAMLAAGLGGLPQIGQRVVVPANEGHPG